MIALLILSVIIAGGITTIPLSVGLLAVNTVIFKRSWVFLLAFGLGLFADLIWVRTLGYSSLMLTIFVFLIRLYERKFETQTATFVFISTLLGSTIYLMVFGYNNVLIQSLVNALFAILVFRLIQNSKLKSQKFK